MTSPTRALRIEISPIANQPRGIWHVSFGKTITEEDDKLIIAALQKYITEGNEVLIFDFSAVEALFLRTLYSVVKSLADRPSSITVIFIGTQGLFMDSGHGAEEEAVTLDQLSNSAGVFHTPILEEALEVLPQLRQSTTYHAALKRGNILDILEALGDFTRQSVGYHRNAPARST